MKGRLRRLALWVMDLICIGISYEIAIELRFPSGMSFYENRSGHVVVAILFVMTYVLDYVVGENRGFMSRSGGREFGRVLRYNLELALGIAVASLIFHVTPTPSRLLIGWFLIINTIVMCLVRWGAKVAARKIFSYERSGSPIVMIVSPRMRQDLERRFRPGTTYRIVGWLELEGSHLDGSIDGHGLSCQVTELPTFIQNLGIEEIRDFFVCVPDAEERVVGRIIDAVEHYGTNCHVAIDMPDPALQGAQLGYFGEMSTVTYVGRGSGIYRNYVKRVLDIIFSLLVVVIAFIPGLLLALAIKLQSGGSPIYTQKRLGRGGRHFKLLKFRSMVSDADDVEKYFTQEQLEAWHRERKVDNDLRITSVGHFLRKTSLDEFPQFINVLKGDMSVVGPRPIVDEELVHYGDSAEEFLSIRPGITGWWQVMARNDATYEDGARQDLELYYVRHASFTLDWNIVKRTVGAVLGGTGK